MRTPVTPSLAIILAALACGASAGDFSRGAAGTTGSEFLTMDMDARGIALGGAHSAATDDAFALYWNPAGLAKVARLSTAFAYARQQEGVNYQSAAVAARVHQTAVLGAGLRRRDAGPVDQTDLSGNRLGTFRPTDLVAEVGWGQTLLDISDSDVELSAGAVGRWIRSDYLLKADGYGGDLGLHARMFAGDRPCDLAFVLQNAGVGQKFDKTRDSLPTKVKLGAAFHPTPALLLTSEAVAPSADVPYGALGVEYALAAGEGMKTAWRAGFNTMTFQSLGPASAFSAGFGLTLRALSVDYAFSPGGALGGSLHRLSISYNLPGLASKRQRDRR